MQALSQLHHWHPSALSDMQLAASVCPASLSLWQVQLHSCLEADRHPAALSATASKTSAAALQRTKVTRGEPPCPTASCSGSRAPQSQQTAASSSQPLRQLLMPTTGRLLSLTAAPMLPQVCCLPYRAAYQAFAKTCNGPLQPPGVHMVIIEQSVLLLFVA